MANNGNEAVSGSSTTVDKTINEESESLDSGNATQQDSGDDLIKQRQIELEEEKKLKARHPCIQRPGSEFLQKRLQRGQKYFDSGDYNMAKASTNPSVKLPDGSAPMPAMESEPAHWITRKRTKAPCPSNHVHNNQNWNPKDQSAECGRKVAALSRINSPTKEPQYRKLPFHRTIVSYLHPHATFAMYTLLGQLWQDHNPLGSRAQTRHMAALPACAAAAETPQQQEKNNSLAPRT